MRILVVFAHPVETSFAAAVHTEVLTTLGSAGHDVRDLDLYTAGFDPVMSRDERVNYEDATKNQAGIEEHVALLRWAEGLIFVYPTWWYGLPAILKGWLDRVWVPQVAFTLPEDDRPIRPLMQHIRLLAGVSTYGAPWWWTKWVGDPGRRTILRGARALCHRRCKTFWLAHYDMDRSTKASRSRFLAQVQRQLAEL